MYEDEEPCGSSQTYPIFLSNDHQFGGTPVVVVDHLHKPNRLHKHSTASNTSTNPSARRILRQTKSPLPVRSRLVPRLRRLLAQIQRALDVRHIVIAAFVFVVLLLFVRLFQPGDQGVHLG